MYGGMPYFMPHVAISGDVANRVKKFVPCVQTE